MLWIEQPDHPNGGCGIACLAMLLDLSYERVCALAPELCEKCGVGLDVIDHVLADHGYAVQRLNEFKEYSGQMRTPWPPAPWAEKHLVTLLQTRTDRVEHHVCMDRTGAVFDPADTKFKKVRLTRYHRILSVAAVILARR